jgi:hypothetical protein
VHAGRRSGDGWESDAIDYDPSGFYTISEALLRTQAWQSKIKFVELRSFVVVVVAARALSEVSISSKINYSR